VCALFLEICLSYDAEGKQKDESGYKAERYAAPNIFFVAQTIELSFAVHVTTRSAGNSSCVQDNVPIHKLPVSFIAQPRKRQSPLQ
jgi:hypothetical protein